MFTFVVKTGMFRLLLVLPLLALADDKAIRLNNLGALPATWRLHEGKESTSKLHCMRSKLPNPTRRRMAHDNG